MQVERQNKIVEAELSTKLKVGGRWYYPGDVVKLDAADAEVYASRGIIKRPKVEKAEPNAPPETLRPEQVGVQLKDAQPDSANAEKDTGMTKPEESNNGRTRKHR